MVVEGKRQRKQKRREMEGVIRRCGHEGVVKEEWNSLDSVRRSFDSNGGDDGGCKEVFIAKVGSSRKSSSPEQEGLSLTNKVSIKEDRSTVEPGPKAPSSRQMEQDAQLESARAEMGEVREENQRLKLSLDHITKDYQALQMQIYEIIQKEETKKSTDTAANTHQACEERDLVSLSLGFARDLERDTATENIKTSGQGADDEPVKKGLSLGLDCKFDLPKSDIREKQSSMNSLDKAKEESGETMQPSKALKTTRNGDEVLEHNTAKKARVSVRARCDTPTMNDGCQWRKYGQKISKGNPCPRAYYRCTVGPSCPVRKQVQRCAHDASILIATYEGTHNHRLPVSATAMASTTSAAASMLLSGSSSSSSPLTGPNASANTTSSAFHALKFHLSDNSKSPAKPFFTQNSSLTSSPSYPTITLDLTSNPTTSSSHFNRFSSSHLPVPKFPSTSFSFGSSESRADAFPGYGSTSQHYSRNQLGTLNLGIQSVDSTVYQSYMQKNPPQPSLPDDIAAATKAVTSDPSFQSALAAALTSLFGSSSPAAGSGGSANMGSGGNNFPQKLKWDDHFPVANSYLTSSIDTACAASFINKTTSTSSQPGSLVFLPPSLPFSVPKGASTSPGNDGDCTS